MRAVVQRAASSKNVASTHNRPVSVESSSFLPRDAMYPLYKPWACVCVCVRLCLSVTSRSSTKTAKRRITQTTPHDSPGTQVSDAKDLNEIRLGSPPTRAPNAGGVGQNRRLSTNIRLDRRRVFKFGGRVSHVTRHVLQLFKVKRSKVKVKRSRTSNLHSQGL